VSYHYRLSLIKKRKSHYGLYLLADKRIIKLEEV